jgi:hypothetical protein
MRTIDYDEIDAATKKRFPGTTFNISCFDSVLDIDHKVIDYFNETIIIRYQYRSEYYKKMNIWLQDVDYITVTRRDVPYIRFCDVIDAIRGSEMSGAIKPCHHLYLEDIRFVDDGQNRIPMYTICWGS